jgi:hypothetical protein
MNAIIGARSCHSCLHRRIAGQEIFCYRYPPAVHVVPVQQPNGKPGFGFQSVYPSVNPDMPCGEYSRSEMFAAEEAQPPLSARMQQ